MVVSGRYVLTPSIWPRLKSLTPKPGAELTLTEALFGLLNEGLMGCLIKGERFDAGDRLGFLKLALNAALHRPELKENVLTICRQIVDEAGKKSLHKNGREAAQMTHS